MNKKKTRNRLANLVRLRKSYQASDFLVTSSELRVKKDVYTLRKIKQLEIRRLGLKENAINIVSLALVLSAATWAFVPQFGLYMLALTFILAFVSWRNTSCEQSLREQMKLVINGCPWLAVVLEKNSKY